MIFLRSQREDFRKYPSKKELMKNHDKFVNDLREYQEVIFNSRYSDIDPIERHPQVKYSKFLWWPMTFETTAMNRFAIIPVKETRWLERVVIRSEIRWKPERPDVSIPFSERWKFFWEFLTFKMVTPVPKYSDTEIYLHPVAFEPSDKSKRKVEKFMKKQEL